MDGNGTSPTASDLEGLRRAISLANDTSVRGNQPYGAVLFDRDGQERFAGANTVNETRNCTDHAEMRVVQAASPHMSREDLAGSTIYCSGEPCVMCTGAIFLAGIGRIVFALSAERGREISDGEGIDRLPSIRLASADVVARGEAAVSVWGGWLEEEAAGVFRLFVVRQAAATASASDSVAGGLDNVGDEP
jgi:tRNA(adenine34) deaminase